MRTTFGVLLSLAIALAAGLIGFQAGVASNIGAAGGVVYLGGGFPGVGLLVFLLFLGFVFLAVGGMRRRGSGHGWGGPGHWGPGSDARAAWVADVHRRLHEEEASGTRPDGPAGS